MTWQRDGNVRRFLGWFRPVLSFVVWVAQEIVWGTEHQAHTGNRSLAETLKDIGIYVASFAVMETVATASLGAIESRIQGHSIIARCGPVAVYVIALFTVVMLLKTKEPEDVGTDAVTSHNQSQRGRLRFRYTRLERGWLWLGVPVLLLLLYLAVFKGETVGIRLLTWAKSPDSTKHITDFLPQRFDPDAAGRKWNVLPFYANLRDGQFVFPVIFEVELKKEYQDRFHLGNMSALVEGTYQSMQVHDGLTVQRMVIMSEEQRQNYKIIIRLNPKNKDAAQLPITEDMQKLIDVTFRPPQFTDLKTSTDERAP